MSFLFFLFILFFFCLIFLLSVGLHFISLILNIPLWFKRKFGKGGYGESSSRQSGQYEEYVPQPGHRQGKKIFGEDEGEYVDYEEVEK